jgi:transposase
MGIKKLPATIEDCHILLKEQGRLIEELYAQLKILMQENKRLMQENRDLRELLYRNANNSSQPPSQSKVKPKNNRVSSGKPSGGQKGHEGHYRELLAEEEVDEIVHCKLPEKCSCGGKIIVEEECVRHQVHELPEINLHITEYKLAKGECACCGERHIAELPEGVTWGITGPKLTGFMSALTSHYQLSRREVQEFLKEYFNFSASLGTVFNKEKIVTQALKETTDNLLVDIKKSPYLHADETGHKRDGKKECMWSISTLDAAYFAVLASRGKKAMKSLIGDYRNIVISDRYSVYDYFDSENRQLCWAHLKRDFARLAEKDDKIISRIGRDLLVETGSLFERWHKFKNGGLTRDMLIIECTPIRKRIGELLEQASYTAPELKAARFAKNLLERYEALWTFLREENVEPTNNHAERCLRKRVIWRKKYFGTRSKIGDLFVARTASVIATCRLQGKNVRKCLSGIMEKHFAKKPSPLFSEI